MANTSQNLRFQSDFDARLPKRFVPTPLADNQVTFLLPEEPIAAQTVVELNTLTYTLGVDFSLSAPDNRTVTWIHPTIPLESDDCFAIIYYPAN